MTAIVEMSESFQSRSLVMFSPDRESQKYINLACAVLAVIKTACQEFGPRLDVTFYPTEPLGGTAVLIIKEGPSRRGRAVLINEGPS